MKQKILTITILLFSSISLFSQAPNWKWSKSISGYCNITANIVSDGNGNIYIAGYFNDSTLDMGNIILTNPDNTGYGEDIFFAKYDSSGSILWAKQFGGGGVYDLQECQDITIDKIGNVYLTGWFSDTITFDNIILTSSGTNGSGSFIAKFDTSGNVIWAKGLGGDMFTPYNSITTDILGNVYLTGSFKGPYISFDSDTLTGLGVNVFIAKYDSSGNIIWAKSSSGGDTGYNSYITTDKIGNSYINSAFSNDTISFDNISLYNTSGHDHFIVKYDSSGNVVWAKNGDYGFTDFIADSISNLFITGCTSVSSSMNFGNQSLNYPSYGNSDIFIFKIDTSGNVIWIKSAGGANNETGASICADIFGNLYLTGSFDSPSITFGASTTVINTNSLGNYLDIFVAEYDTSGSVLWAKSAGGSGNDYGSCITTDVAGNIYVSGPFSGSSVIFGTDTLYNSISPVIYTYIAKLGSTITKIDKTLNNNLVIIYPNPTNEILNIRNAENSELVIYNLLGETVLKTKCNSAFSTINVSGLAEGTYIVKVVSEKNIVTKKICVIK